VFEGVLDQALPFKLPVNLTPIVAPGNLYRLKLSGEVVLCASGSARLVRAYRYALGAFVYADGDVIGYIAG
jgi:hypothetical protein